MLNMSRRDFVASTALAAALGLNARLMVSEAFAQKTPDPHAYFYRKLALGVATSGPETGGSQFFLCHSPQPHLDGRYTVAGQLRSGDEVLDALQPGDTILSASAE